MRLAGTTIGFAITGSHCTLSRAVPYIGVLREEGAKVIPIVSTSVLTTETRFGNPSHWLEEIRRLSDREPLTTIVQVERIGPERLLDLLAIAPCTGNTLAKIANGITDTPVTMAAKAQLRNGRPVLLAISTNDALGFNAKNIGVLMITKNVYFVPFGQDNPVEKPTSVDARLDLLVDSILAALKGQQIQPVLIQYTRSNAS